MKPRAFWRSSVEAENDLSGLCVFARKVFGAVKSYLDTTLDRLRYIEGCLITPERRA